MNIQTLTKDKELSPCPSWMGKTLKLGAVSLFAMNLCVAPTVFAGSKVHNPKSIFINNVFVEASDHSMNVVGNNFDKCKASKPLQVTVKRFVDDANIALATSTRIELSIAESHDHIIRTLAIQPDLLADGNYRMIVRCKKADNDTGSDSSSADIYDDAFNIKKGDVFDFTIGAVGPQGEQGDQGKIGPQGVQGKIGDTGGTGAQGPQGKIGDTGGTGAQGPQGKIGDTGGTGDTGDTGATGLQGEQGKLGPEGPPPACDGTEDGCFGAQGPQGKLGPAGADGDDGVQGIQGPQGKQGPSGTPAPALQRFVVKSLCGFASQKVPSTQFVNQASRSGSCGIACPPGFLATGGGVSFASAGPGTFAAFVTESTPQSLPNGLPVGWIGAGGNPPFASAASVTVFAVCVQS